MTQTATLTQTQLRPLTDVISLLSADIDKRLLSKRKQGGKELTYISWHDAVNLFNQIYPFWSYEIRCSESIGGKLILTVRVTIQTTDGEFFREATGQEDEEKDTFGDSSSNAESMALRRAFSKFGLGLYLYNGDVKHTPNQLRAVQQPKPQPKSSNLREGYKMIVEKTLPEQVEVLMNCFDALSHQEQLTEAKEAKETFKNGIFNAMTEKLTVEEISDALTIVAGKTAINDFTAKELCDLFDYCQRNKI